MLKIQNLNLTIQSKEIIKNLSLDIKSGEIHILLGKNGSGKSTLSNFLSGDCYMDISGHVFFKEKSLFDYKQEELFLNGLFLSPQNPVEISGLSPLVFFREILNNKNHYLGKNKIDNMVFLQQIKKLITKYNFSESYLKSGFNEGFSGGEKKRNELLQIELFNPDFIILDELDSGLDINMLSYSSHFINSFINQDKSFLIITHNPEFIKMINYTKIHLLEDGAISKSGGLEVIDFLKDLS